MMSSLSLSGGESETPVGRQLSCVSEAGIEDEVEMLKNIYMEDELLVNTLDCGAVEVSIHITPSTGGDMDRQYLYLDLCLRLGLQYPKEAAVVCIKSSRGLSDTRLRHVVSNVEQKACELRGCAMLYELVEVAKDCLTEHNLPSDHCPICLVFFQEGDECTRSDCYHYFHVTCLADYIQFCERQHAQEDKDRPPHSRPLACSFMCPVCREELASDSSCLAAVSQVTASLSPFVPQDTKEIQISQEVRAWQKEMAALLEHQRKIGGLIDLSAKDEVIDETWVRPKPSTSEVSLSLSKEESVLEKVTEDEDGCSRPSIEIMPGSDQSSSSRNRRKGAGKSSQAKQDRLGDKFENEGQRRKGDSASPRFREQNKDRRRLHRDSHISDRGERQGGRRPASNEARRKEVMETPSDRDRTRPGANFIDGRPLHSSVTQPNRRRKNRSKEKSCQLDGVGQRSGQLHNEDDHEGRLLSTMESLCVSASSESSRNMVGDTGSAEVWNEKEKEVKSKK